MNTAAELRVGGWLVCVAFAASLGGAPLSAQAPPRGNGERVSLVVRPHVGDTLWLAVEQTIETRSLSAGDAVRTGGARGDGSRSPASRRPDYGPIRDAANSQTTYMRLNAHSTVEASDLKATWLAVLTDSLHVRTGTGGQLGPVRAAILAPEDRRTRINVTPDGAMSVLDVRKTNATLAAGLSGMPPMLPARAVAIGDEWEREIPLPSIPLTGVRTEGVVHAQFRLDSLTKGGRLAWVSLNGTLRREGAARDMAPGTQVVSSGILRGYLILDRTRGWITEAETNIEMQSSVIPRPGDNAPARTLDIRLQQRMKVR